MSTVKEAWEILDKLFGASGKNAKVNLKLQLFKINMASGGDFAIHLNVFKSLLGQLASIKAPVEVDDSIALLLKSLSDDYENIVTTLLNMPSLTLADVESSLMDDYNNKKFKVQSTIENLDSAYFSKSRINTGNRYKEDNKRKPCGFCDRDNHKE